MDSPNFGSLIPGRHWPDNVREGPTLSKFRRLGWGWVFALHAYRRSPPQGSIRRPHESHRVFHALRLVVLTILSCSGCAVTFDGPRSILYQDVTYAVQANAFVRLHILGAGVIETHRRFNASIESLGIRQVVNTFVPPNTSHYFTSTCDKFYLNSQSVSKCNGVVNLDESYTQLYRTDTNNLNGGSRYQILVISQEVVPDQVPSPGELLGITTPRADVPEGPQTGSFIFDTEILRARSRMRADCGDPGDLLYLVTWVVNHELARQIGGLRAPYDFQGLAEHNPNTLSYDIMSALGYCDPVHDTPHGFCSDNDADPTNSCVDKLKAKFFP